MEQEDSSRTLLEFFLLWFLVTVGTYDGTQDFLPLLIVNIFVVILLFFMAYFFAYFFKTILFSVNEYKFLNWRTEELINLISIPTSRQLEQIFPILKANQVGVPLESLMIKYKELEGPLSDIRLRGVISKHTRNCNNYLLPKSKLAAACKELKIIELLRERERRNALFMLPSHLRLGISIEGIREHLRSLPSTAVDEFNNAMSLGYDEKPTYLLSEDLNGYVNQFHIKKAAERDGLAHCERLRDQSPHIGEAEVFVSWHLKTSMPTLVDALEQYVKKKELPPSTKFWVSDFVMRQTAWGDSKKCDDRERLGECVHFVGHTVLVIESWLDPEPLRRAYCIKEIYHTQEGWGKFDVALPSAQKTLFDNALHHDFDSIATSVSNIDVRKATCLDKDDAESILNKIESTMGFDICNSVVIQLLQKAMVHRGIGVMVKLANECGGSLKVRDIVAPMGPLLMNMGSYDAALHCFIMSLHPQRQRTIRKILLDMEKPDQDYLFESNITPDELTVIESAGLCHLNMGRLEEALPLLEIALQGWRKTHGDEHPRTCNAISNMKLCLQKMGRLEEPLSLMEEGMQDRRQAHGLPMLEGDMQDPGEALGTQQCSNLPSSFNRPEEMIPLVKAVVLD